MEEPRGGRVLVELVRLAIVVLFVAVGHQIATSVADDPRSVTVLLGAILGSATGYVAGGVSGRAVRRMAGSAEARLEAIPGADFVAGGMGMVAGSLLGSLLGWPLLLVPSRSIALPVLGAFVVTSGYLGLRVGLRKREDLLQLVGLTYRTRAGDLRVLDTSAILDTRLLSFVRAGLIRGTLLLPGFVLEEAQGIADAQDTVRRRRAHRGLEALAAIKREGLVAIQAVDRTYPEYEDVDAKIVALARERGASLITDDAALARISELQGIEVLFMRRMAEAFRIQAVPGEKVSLEIVREGSKPGQGVGYLDDGTMVVVENGARFLGSRIDASISRSVPTGGGNLLFAEPVEES